MEIMNLDKFSNRKKFVSNGVEHSIRGMKVKELKPFTDEMKKASDDDSRIGVMVKVLTKLTDMTENELTDLEIGELSALISISQGGDPDKDSEGE